MADKATVSFGFDSKAPEAQAVAKKTAALLVGIVSKETKKAIRLLIVRAIRDGIAPHDAARMIRGIIRPKKAVGMVGLNRQQVKAALSYRAMLEDLGLSSTSIEATMAKYIKRKIKERATMIARTELMAALNKGQMESLKQAQKEGLLGKGATKTVIVTPDELLCQICSPMSGVSIPVKEKFETDVGSFQSPPFHPNCRCAVAIDRP